MGAWKYINKHRKKRENKWKHRVGKLGKSFCGFVGRHEEESSVAHRRGEKWERRKGTRTKKLVRQLKKLKDRKAPGENGIKNEAWRYMSEEVSAIFW